MYLYSPEYGWNIPLLVVLFFVVVAIAIGIYFYLRQKNQSSEIGYTYDQLKSGEAISDSSTTPEQLEEIIAVEEEEEEMPQEDTALDEWLKKNSLEDYDFFSLMKHFGLDSEFIIIVNEANFGDDGKITLVIFMNNGYGYPVTFTQDEVAFRCMPNMEDGKLTAEFTIFDEEDLKENCPDLSDDQTPDDVFRPGDIYDHIHEITIYCNEATMKIFSAK